MGGPSLCSVASLATRAHTTMAEHKYIHSAAHERRRTKVHGEQENLGWVPRKEVGFTGNRLVYVKMFILKTSPRRKQCLQPE